MSKVELNLLSVEEAKWLTKLEMNELINSNKVIPHIEDYEILRNVMI